MTDTDQSCAKILPVPMPGHWDTNAGREMALATLDDPHMAASRQRISDFALANEVFLSPGIANLTDAKERIRWLSATLAVQSLACGSGDADMQREPTEAMIEAGAKVWLGQGYAQVGTEWRAYARATWRAMYDAAPSNEPAIAEEPPILPRQPTTVMINAGMYQSSHDSTHADVEEIWKAMFDAVALDGGCSTALRAQQVPVVVNRIMALVEERLCIHWYPAANRDAFERLLTAALVGEAA